MKKLRFDVEHSEDDVSRRAEQAEGMTEEILAELRGQKKEQFAEQSNRLAERCGLASEAYMQWLHEQYVHVICGVRAPRQGHGGPHFISGSTHKRGSHASGKHRR